MNNYFLKEGRIDLSLGIRRTILLIDIILNKYCLYNTVPQRTRQLWIIFELRLLSNINNESKISTSVDSKIGYLMLRYDIANRFAKCEY